MKTFSYLTALLLALTTVSAQAQKYAKEAKKAFKDDDLVTAMELIEKAILDEKDGDKPQTWLNRGEIYLAAYEDPAMQDEAIEHFKLAMESFNKLREMTNSSYYTGEADKFTLLKYQEYRPAAATFWENEKYDSASLYFELSHYADPNDIGAMLFSGYADMEMGDYKSAFAKMDYMMQYSDEELQENVEMDKKTLYNNMFYIQVTELENPEKALEVINEAVAEYPEDPKFAEQRVALLLQMDKTEDAEKDLRKALEREPDNAMFNYQLGQLLDKAGNKEEAIKYYEKTLEIEPNNLLANFNLGSVYYNQAAELSKEANNLGMEEVDKQDAIIEEANALFAKAEPYMKAAYDEAPEEAVICRALYVIYYQTEQDDKVEEMEAHMESLGIEL